jgi:protoporphyrinogen oxidase
MKICVIGAGLTGLTAAYELSDDASVTLLERDPVLGGCLSSYRLNGSWIERYYHHCFAGDRNLLRLLDALGLGGDLEWLSGSTGYLVDGTIHPLTTPLEILRYPHLSLVDKARLGWLTLRANRYDVERLDDETAVAFIERTLGTRLYRRFFEPLLRSKFGERRGEVSAAWLISRIAIRSNRGAQGERLGYLKGGYHRLIDAMEERLAARGAEIRTGTAAERLEQTNGRWSVNGTPYDAVISTIAPHRLHVLGGPSLPPVPYQGAACMTLGLDRDVTGGIYWLNLADPAPYGAVVGHTNFVPMDRYGEHIVYLASYFMGDAPAGLEERMLADFRQRFKVPADAIHWHKLAVDPAAGPVYTTGYRRLIPPYRTSGIFMAGMFSRPNYPERSMEGSVTAGIEVAGEVRKVLSP